MLPAQLDSRSLVHRMLSPPGERRTKSLLGLLLVFIVALEDDGPAQADLALRRRAKRVVPQLLAALKAQLHACARQRTLHPQVDKVTVEIAIPASLQTHPSIERIPSSALS